MAEEGTEVGVTQAVEVASVDREEEKISNVDFLHNELSNVNRKLEVMQLALKKAKEDHKIAIENKDKDIHNLEERLNNMQEVVDRLKFEKEKLYMKASLRECDMTELKREIGKLKLQLEETEAKARRENVSAILMAQEKVIKEELKDEIKTEMERNTRALHDDMVNILKEIRAEKEDVAAIRAKMQGEKKVGVRKHTPNNKGNCHHKNCLEKAHH